MIASRRIALLMGPDAGFSRDVIRGVRAYAIDKKDWLLQNGPPELSVVQAIRQWKPHGLIAQLLTEELAHAVLRLRKPVVDTSCSVPWLRVPLVDVDHEAVGQMAAQYFLDRGYRHFGFFGSEWAHYSKLREAAFRLRLAEAGHTVSACYIEYLLRVPAILEWKRAAHRVREWLEKLSKPVGILTANDIPARELAGACLRFGLRVPDDVALLGVDNDDLECGFSWPPLSSVATPARRIGYEAAKLLDELMAGKSPPREPILLPPIAVVTRQSTDTLAIDDPAVVAALRFIRAQATGTIRVDDVVQHAVQGRRMLEYKFRDFVGHTILEEIRRVRIERVKELLRDTDLSMPAIARRSGFITPERMSVVFRELTGLTPSGYRQQAAIRDL